MHPVGEDPRRAPVEELDGALAGVDRPHVDAVAQRPHLLHALAVQARLRRVDGPRPQHLGAGAPVVAERPRPGQQCQGRLGPAPPHPLQQERIEGGHERLRGRGPLGQGVELRRHVVDQAAAGRGPRLAGLELDIDAHRGLGDDVERLRQGRQALPGEGARAVPGPEPGAGVDARQVGGAQAVVGAGAVGGAVQARVVDDDDGAVADDVDVDLDPPGPGPSGGAQGRRRVLRGEGARAAVGEDDPGARRRRVRARDGGPAGRGVGAGPGRGPGARGGAAHGPIMPRPGPRRGRIAS